MDNSAVYENIPPLTAEEIVELDALDDREIDLTDIPEITDEEWKKFYKVNPSNFEEWEQYYKCNPHRQRLDLKVAG